jgi:ribosome recycling factor
VKDAELQKQLDEIIDQYNNDLDALKRTKDDAIDKLRKESAKYQADEQKAWETALKTLSDFSQKFGKWHGSFDGKSADLIPLLMRVDPKYFFDPFEDLTSFFIRF